MYMCLTDAVLVPAARLVGIELNPGPVYFCNLCLKQHDTATGVPALDCPNSADGKHEWKEQIGKYSQSCSSIMLYGSCTECHQLLNVISFVAAVRVLRIHNCLLFLCCYDCCMQFVFMFAMYMIVVANRALGLYKIHQHQV